MNAKQLIAVSVLAVTGSVAFAQTPAGAEVLQARAIGALLPAGEVDIVNVAGQSSHLSRAAVQADVAQARAEGTLLPAGEASMVVKSAAVPTRDAKEVRDEARRAAHDLRFNPLTAA